jgi:hypothetical protein
MVGTLISVVVLSREEFDAIEFDAACTGDHQAAAERMSALVETGIQTESMPRAEALARAGEQWLLAGDPAAAIEAFWLAMADGGPVEVDPRVSLCRALFQLGREAEARALIEQLKSEGRTDPRTCEMIMELLLEQSDLVGALDWANAGVELVLHGAGDGSQPVGNGAQEQQAMSRSDLLGMLRIRYRIRNDLRLPEDEYDRMLNG